MGLTCGAPWDAGNLMLSSPQHFVQLKQHRRWYHAASQQQQQHRRRYHTASQQQQQQQQPNLSLLEPLLQLQWHPVRNAHLKAKVVKPFSHIKVWWMCDQCPDGHPHEWETQVSKRSLGTGCPFCASRAVCPHNSLATKAPEVAAQWSDSNRGSPHDCMPGSGKKVIWKCYDGHEWEASIKHRTIGHSGCPHCEKSSRLGKKQQRHPALTQSQHPMMQLWDWDANATAGLDPSKITCCSRKRAHWTCPKCPRGQPHRWQARVSSVYLGSGCPCCTGRKACKCNSLKSLHPDLAKEWDYSKNKSMPEDYAASSCSYVWWRNIERGTFRCRIDGRTYVQQPLPAAKPPLGTMPAPVVPACSLPALCLLALPLLFSVPVLILF